MKFAVYLTLAVGLAGAGLVASAETNSPSTATNAVQPGAKRKSTARPYSGSVISVDREAKTFTVSLVKGKLKVIHISAKTKFTKDGAAASFADLDLGESVKGTAHLDQSSNLVASTVAILVPKSGAADNSQ